MREHLASIVSVALLVPTALVSDPRMASVLLILGATYFAANLWVFKHTIDRQKEVEQYHRDLTSRVADVLGNVLVMQSYTRVTAEVSALKNTLMVICSPCSFRSELVGDGLDPYAGEFDHRHGGDLLTGSCSCSTWRSNCRPGGGSVGFAGLLIGRLDQLSYFILGLFGQKPAIDAYFDLLDTANPLLERNRMRQR